ncbi:MAG TPA: site-2 protease family protein [Alphaproteobacteria bacterium]|nr:site-2 protease family protein [Alphaproteobacteria bacterium]
MAKDRRIPLLTLLGFQIRFDLTWLILVALVVWSLSAGYFPASYADLPTSTYVWMGIVGAIGLFASIVLHELAHSWVGRRLGLEIRGITLFVFGGAAELSEEPKSARTELLMAAAGPFASVVLAILFQILAVALEAIAGSSPISAVLRYLAGINAILAVFNLLPAFPLDGGRILRAALWAWRGSVVWATRVATGIGGAIGLGLVILGIISVIGGNIVGGMWLFLIGLFIRSAAMGSQQQLMARHMLQSIGIDQLMVHNPVTIAPDAPVGRAIDLFLANNLKFLPVVADGRAVGHIGLREVKELGAADRLQRPVREAMTSVSPDNSISPDADAATALAQMQRTGLSRLLVVTDGRLAGIVCLKDLLDQLTLRSELNVQPEPT